ncbi:hypothetical protein [Streptomyces sp. ISL-98]|uniref:hypothetical protein n=1 Tax=Streptomyces sp. ISL-98 TaxID=2819192 RepID=UPI0027E41EDF|nr:hypothetical protein [Streptomyces sp. ISL-98]
MLLTLAGHDFYVDTADTERIYRKVLDAGGALTVKRHPDAAHSLLKQSIEQSDLKTTLTALFSPPARSSRTDSWTANDSSSRISAEAAVPLHGTPASEEQ